MGVLPFQDFVTLVETTLHIGTSQKSDARETQTAVLLISTIYVCIWTHEVAC